MWLAENFQKYRGDLVTTPATISDDTPLRLNDAAALDDLLTLDDACELVFDGKIKSSTLRTMRDDGKLTVFRVGRRDFTTVRHIRAMVDLCRVEKPRQGSTSTLNANNGLSATGQSSSALASIEEGLRKLKPHSRPTLA